MRFIRLLVAAACLALATAPAFAQTNPTGTISGRVVDASGLSVPGVTVTAESPALQGPHTAVSTTNGDYILPFLPAGAYTITFELQGFNTVVLKQNLAVAQTVPVNVTMQIAGVSETVNVVGKAEAISVTSQVATSTKADLVDKLPTNRTLEAMVNLAPAVHQTGPSQNITISGSMSYENLFLVNGVVVNENLRGQAQTLYIEDALQESTTATAGVSAEYGRFAGGVVNVVTKSGGNDPSGSFRTTFTNDDWRTVTPYGEPKTNKVNPTYEYTVGGPIAKDKLWFFTAGRLTHPETGQKLYQSNMPYTSGVDQKRFEGKLTYSLNQDHSVKGAYTNILETDENNSFGTIMDQRSLYTRKTPQQLLSLNYTGILSPTFFIEGQFSQRSFTFSGSGSPWTDIPNGTLLLDRALGNTRYWSPTFCGVCTDETRDNQNIIVKATKFWSTEKVGSHNVVFGMDAFDDQRSANNHQSGSDYRIYGTDAVFAGADTIYPVFDNNTYLMWNPIFQLAESTHFRTFSGFVNDSWRYSNNLTFSLGLRYDKNHGTDEAGNLVVTDARFSPRLAVTYDPKGDGNWVYNASFARYVTAVANSIADSQSKAGQPGQFEWYYGGPSINTTAPYIAPDVAIQQLFSWFNATGGISTGRPGVFGVSYPGVNVKIDPNLMTPYTNEIAGGMTKQLGTRGAFHADVSYRKFNDFYVQTVDSTTGKAYDPNGKAFDMNVIGNTNDLKKEYVGANFQATYRPMDTLNLGGNYTISRAWGNYEGENVSSGPITSSVGYYPEYFNAAWSYPTGDLSIDQRHRVRAWASYDLRAGSHGTVNLSVLEQLGSGTPYGASQGVQTQPYVTNPGYIAPPSNVTYFFTSRDAFRTDMDKRTDLAANFSMRPGVGHLELFFNAQLLNAFNQFALFNINSINTTVLDKYNPGGRTFAAFNPFTTAPVQGTNWDLGPKFGQPTNYNAYTVPRTFRFSVGIRF